MKRGFTLVELLAVICLLSFIVLVTYSFVTEGLNNANKRVDEAISKLLVSGTDSYINDNYSSYSTTNSTVPYCVTFDTLLNENYIDLAIFNQTDLSRDDYMVFYGNGNWFDIEVDYKDVCKS
ncbi:MAG: type II secretion system protein [Bacilli bacterium]|nr:type II secretion system protein [Bacilli bacterium]